MVAAYWSKNACDGIEVAAGVLGVTGVLAVWQYTYTACARVTDAICSAAAHLQPVGIPHGNAQRCDMHRVNPMRKVLASRVEPS